MHEDGYKSRPSGDIVFGWLLVGQVLHDLEESKAEDGGEGGRRLF